MSEKEELRVKGEKKDLEVLRRLGFEVRAQMPVAEAWTRIRERLISRDIGEICRRCEWLDLGYCAEGLEKLGS